MYKILFKRTSHKKIIVFVHSETPIGKLYLGTLADGNDSVFVLPPTITDTKQDKYVAKQELLRCGVSQQACETMFLV